MDDPAHLIARLQRHGIDIEEIGKTLGKDWVEVGRCRDCRFYHFREYNERENDFGGFPIYDGIPVCGYKELPTRDEGYCSNFKQANIKGKRCGADCKHATDDALTARYGYAWRCAIQSAQPQESMRISECNAFEEIEV